MLVVGINSELLVGSQVPESSGFIQHPLSSQSTSPSPSSSTPSLHSGTAGVGVIVFIGDGVGVGVLPLLEAVGVGVGVPGVGVVLGKTFTKHTAVLPIAFTRTPRGDPTAFGGKMFVKEVPAPVFVMPIGTSHCPDIGFPYDFA